MPVRFKKKKSKPPFTFILLCQHLQHWGALPDSSGHLVAVWSRCISENLFRNEQIKNKKGILSQAIYWTNLVDPERLLWTQVVIKCSQIKKHQVNRIETEGWNPSKPKLSGFHTITTIRMVTASLLSHLGDEVSLSVFHVQSVLMSRWPFVSVWPPRWKITGLGLCHYLSKQSLLQIQQIHMNVLASLWCRGVFQFFSHSFVYGLWQKPSFMGHLITQDLTDSQFCSISVTASFLQKLGASHPMKEAKKIQLAFNPVFFPRKQKQKQIFLCFLYITYINSYTAPLLSRTTYIPVWTKQHRTHCMVR